MRYLLFTFKAILAALFNPLCSVVFLLLEIVTLLNWSSDSQCLAQAWHKVPAEKWFEKSHFHSSTLWVANIHGVSRGGDVSAQLWSTGRMSRSPHRRARMSQEEEKTFLFLHSLGTHCVWKLTMTVGGSCCYHHHPRFILFYFIF